MDKELITGEYDALDVEQGGDGIVYAQTAEEAKGIRAELRARGIPSPFTSRSSLRAQPDISVGISRTEFME